MNVINMKIGFASTQGSIGLPNRNSIHVVVAFDLEDTRFAGHFTYDRVSGQLHFPPIFTHKGRCWHFLDPVQYAVPLAEKAARNAAQQYRDKLGTGIPVA